MSAMKFRLVSLASTNLNPVKQYGANLKGALLINTNAAARYVKLYESTDAPVVGTTKPAITIEVPASSQVPLTWPDGLQPIPPLAGSACGQLALASCLSVDAGAVTPSHIFTFPECWRVCLRIHHAACFRFKL